MNKRSKLERYQEKFEKLDIETLDLKDGEKIVHCIDQKSFWGKFFCPEWAITNMGRGYSLSRRKWLVPQATGERRYWHFVGTEKQPAVHELVANYFKDESDKIAIEEFGEDGVNVQHNVPIDIPDELKTGRIEHCMKCNCKSNLSYQKKDDNNGIDRRLTCGNLKEEDKQKMDEEIIEYVTMFSNSGRLHGNSNGARIIYSRDAKGNLIETINTVLNLKGSFLDKDTIEIGEYKVNAGADGKQFVEEHASEILKEIKKNPPKKKCFRRYKIFGRNTGKAIEISTVDDFYRKDAIFVYYTLK